MLNCWVWCSLTWLGLGFNSLRLWWRHDLTDSLNKPAVIISSEYPHVMHGLASKVMPHKPLNLWMTPRISMWCVGQGLPAYPLLVMRVCDCNNCKRVCRCVMCITCLWPTMTSSPLGCQPYLSDCPAWLMHFFPRKSPHWSLATINSFSLCMRIKSVFPLNLFPSARRNSTY